MQSTKIDFYNALKNAVMFSPKADTRCRQLQTFRVLEHGGGGKLTADNFGATACDKDKPFFWSRSWHNQKYKGAPVWEFPVLVLVERGYIVDEPFQNRQKRAYEFNISVLDKYDPGKDKMKCSGCEGRTINEIYEDTEALLFQALRFIGECNEFRVGTENVLLPEAVMAKLKASGAIMEYIPGVAFGDLVQQKIREQTAYKAAIYPENIFGNSINLNIPFAYCQNIEWDFSCVPEFPVLRSDLACDNCG